MSAIRGRRRVLLPLAAAALLVVPLGAPLPAGAHAGARTLAHVTLIGDSVASAIPGDTDAIRVLRMGSDLDLEVAPCRRLVDPSCPPNPPTVVDVIKRLGAAVGPTVVIAVGYNDFEDHYASEIDDTLAALDAASVKRIFWLTMRAAHHPYINMNDEIVAAAASRSNMTVIDWNVYSRSHPEWFQADGIHLLAPGSRAMAGLIHDKLVAAGVAAQPVRIKTTTLPAARRLHAYHSSLAATSGVAPYTWSLTGRLPAGLHLLGTGVLSGAPHGPKGGVYTVVVRVKDAIGQTATRKLLLRLR
jgi:hypothetical protein